MGKKIVGMISSYPNLNPSAGDWLWNQTPHAFGVWGNIQMLAPGEKPDWLLMYQFDFPRPPQQESWLSRLRRKQPAANIDISSQLRSCAKERIIYLLREPPLDEVVAKNKANYQKAKQYCGYISGPDDLAPNPGYMPAIWYISNSFRDLNELGAPEKVKTCSWITSGINRTANHRQRLAFLRLLQSREVNFDLYGRDLPDWAQSRGRVGMKWSSMAPYYYNLAIENYAENSWYVSEKLWDALLAWCLPIYYGGPAASELLPPGSFLRLPSLDERGLSYIQETISSPDAWYEAREAIAEARQIILHKLNLLNWLSDFVGQVS